MKREARKKLIPVKHQVGDVVWAKFHRRPWWGCRVCFSPLMNSHSIMKEANRRIFRQYYVETLEDPAEKYWVNERGILLFEGKHQFPDLPDLRKKSRQTAKVYKHRVPKTCMATWQKSVAIAEDLLSKVPDTKNCSTDELGEKLDYGMLESCRMRPSPYPPPVHNGCVKQPSVFQHPTEIKLCPKSSEMASCTGISRKVDNQVKNVGVRKMPGCVLSLARVEIALKALHPFYMQGCSKQRVSGLLTVAHESPYVSPGAELKSDISRNKKAAEKVNQDSLLVDAVLLEETLVPMPKHTSVANTINAMGQGFVTACTERESEVSVKKYTSLANKIRNCDIMHRAGDKSSDCILGSTNLQVPATKAEASIQAERADSRGWNTDLNSQLSAEEQNWLQLKEPKKRIIRSKCKAGSDLHSQTPGQVEITLLSDTKEMDSLVQQEKLDSPELIDNKHDRSRDATEMETAVVKHVLSDLKEVSTCSANKDISDETASKPFMPVLSASTPDQNVAPSETDYKYSTLLMMLKDMHETQTKEHVTTGQDTSGCASPGLASTVKPLSCSAPLADCSREAELDQSHSTSESSWKGDTTADTASNGSNLSRPASATDLCGAHVASLQMLEPVTTTCGHVGNLTAADRTIKQEVEEIHIFNPDDPKSLYIYGADAINDNHNYAMKNPRVTFTLGSRGCLVSEERARFASQAVDDSQQRDKGMKCISSCVSVKGDPELDSERSCEGSGGDEVNELNHMVSINQRQRLIQNSMLGTKRTYRHRNGQQPKRAYVRKNIGSMDSKGAVLLTLAKDPEQTAVSPCDGHLNKVKKQLTFSEHSNGDLICVKTEPVCPPDELELLPQAHLQKKCGRKPNKHLLLNVDEAVALPPPKKRARNINGRYVKMNANLLVKSECVPNDSAINTPTAESCFSSIKALPAIKVEQTDVKETPNSPDYGHAVLQEHSRSSPNSGTSAKEPLQAEDPLKKFGTCETKRQRKPTKKLLESMDLGTNFLPLNNELSAIKTDLSYLVLFVWNSWVLSLPSFTNLLKH